MRMPISSVWTIRNDRLSWAPCRNKSAGARHNEGRDAQSAGTNPCEQSALRHGHLRNRGGEAQQAKAADLPCPCAHGPGQPWRLQRRPYENFLITSRRGLVRDSELNYEFSRWKYEPFAMAGLDLLCGYPPRSVQPLPFALRVRSAAMVIRRRKVGHCAWLGAGQAAAWRRPSRSAARR